LRLATPGNAPRVNQLTARLAERMRQGSQLLRWCAENGASGKQATVCADLTASAARASFDLALASSQGHPQAQELKEALQQLSRQMRAVIRAQVDGATPGYPEKVQAAIIRYAQRLPAGLARHSVPAVISTHASGPAELTVGKLTPEETKVAPWLSARLTVLDGDAIKITGQPVRSQTQLADGPFKWVWTLEGVHAGRAEVRMELFVEPPPEAGGGGALTPIHYETWEDDITVQPSVLEGVREAATDAGVWLVGGVAAVAGACVTAFWIRRRQPLELRSVIEWIRRGG
jgi:hypothetical protein